jgi:hypothetical protein
MNNYRQLLEQVRDLKIKEDDLPPISYDAETELIEDPVVIQRAHVINLLKRYKQERISQSDLFNWIHFVWFSDFFTCDDNDADCIASVVAVLEELEEEGDMMPEDVDCCLLALENNRHAERIMG